MKRKVLVPLLLSLLLSGCSANVPEEATTSSSSQNKCLAETVESSQSSLSDTKTVTRASASGSTSESVSETGHQRLRNSKRISYQVDMSQQSNVLTVSFEDSTFLTLLLLIRAKRKLLLKVLHPMIP